MVAVNSLITFRHAAYCWDDGCVIFQWESDQTHLIEGLGAEIFKIMVSQPILTYQQLRKNLVDAVEWPTDFDVEANLNTLLTQYQVLSLLDVAKSPSA